MKFYLLELRLYSEPPLCTGLFAELPSAISNDRTIIAAGLFILNDKAVADRFSHSF